MSATNGVIERRSIFGGDADALDPQDASGGSAELSAATGVVGRRLRAVGRRLLSTVATLIGVSVAIFVLLELVPGDPAQVAAGEFATEADVERVREQMNLDEPIAVRYGAFIADVVRGDLGTSVQVRPGAEVLDILWDALPVTASLTLVSLGLAILLSLPLGFLAALRRRSVFDRGVSLGASMSLAIPPYVLGLLLITLFALDRTWFPPLGYVPFSEDPVEWLRHLVLPCLTLAAVPLAELTRQVRGSLIDTLDQDFIRATEARGLRRRQIVAKHAMKNAAAPVVTVAGLQFARVIGGSVLIEQIFGLSGVGSITYAAVTRRDLPLIIGIVVMSAVVVLIVNLLVDLINGRLSPRSA